MQEAQNRFETVPWTIRDVWWGAAFLGLWLAISLAGSLAIQFSSLDVDLGLIVSLAELLLLLPVWWLALRRYRVGWPALGLRRFGGVMLGLGCLLMIFSYTFNLFYSLFLAFFNLRMQADLSPVFDRLSSPWSFLVGGAIVAPLVEEIFFRGFVFAGLRQRYGWQKAALISSALFALVHLQLAALIPIFILGCIFAYLYQRSGSIWPAVLMHIASNALALGAAFLIAETGWAG